jgi:hypothetical protein
MWTAHKIAMFPTPVKVCGVSLLPPSVGAFKILEHLENPYTCGGLETVESLFCAVLVCKYGYARSMRMIRNPVILALRMKWLAFRVRRLRLDWKKESVKFRRFVDECSWVPTRFVKDGEEHPLPNGVPMSYRIEDLIPSRYTESQIMDMPMPKANLHILAHSANKGSEYESAEDYQQAGYPEGYAYHEEDWPAVTEMMEAIKAHEAARVQAQADADKAVKEGRTPPAVPPPVNTKASLQKAVLIDLERMEKEITCAN